MSDHRRRIELGAGAGLVAVIGDIALFVTDSDAAHRLVEVAREVVVADSPPGRTFARRLAALLTSEEADRVPDFGAVADAGGEWVVFLYGHVAASIDMADGTEEHLAGTASATWVDRIVPDAGAVLIGPAGFAPPDPTPFRLDAGVVPGGWVRIVRFQPRDDVTSEMATAIPGVAPAPAPPPTPEPSTEEFELFSLSSDGLEQREPLPIDGSVGATVEVEAAPGVAAPTGARPSLGLVVFDDGSAFGLDADYVLGREPETDDSVTAGSARAIALDDPDGTVSRVHAEIRLIDSDVHLIDRGSTNGTHLWDESTGAWDRLVPGQPRVIRPGARGAVGQRTFAYEVPFGPAGGSPPAPRPASGSAGTPSPTVPGTMPSPR